VLKGEDKEAAIEKKTEALAQASAAIAQRAYAAAASAGGAQPGAAGAAGAQPKGAADAKEEVSSRAAEFEEVNDKDKGRKAPQGPGGAGLSVCGSG
jgi:hypothetical protein